MLHFSDSLSPDKIDGVVKGLLPLFVELLRFLLGHRFDFLRHHQN